MTPLKLLIVEDSQSDALLIQVELKSVSELQFSTEHAATLADALDILSRYTFDAILLDLSLPDCFGLETYINVRRSAGKIPIIIFTGDHDASIAEQATVIGNDNYVLKTKIDGKRLATAILVAISNAKNPHH